MPCDPLHNIRATEQERHKLEWAWRLPFGSILERSDHPDFEFQRYVDDPNALILPRDRVVRNIHRRLTVRCRTDPSRLFRDTPSFEYLVISLSGPLPTILATLTSSVFPQYAIWDSGNKLWEHIKHLQMSAESALLGKIIRAAPTSRKPRLACRDILEMRRRWSRVVPAPGFLCTPGAEPYTHEEETPTEAGGDGHSGGSSTAVAPSSPRPLDAQHPRFQHRLKLFPDAVDNDNDVSMCSDEMSVSCESHVSGVDDDGYADAILKRGYYHQSQSRKRWVQSWVRYTESEDTTDVKLLNDDQIAPSCESPRSPTTINLDASRPKIRRVFDSRIIF